MSTSLKVAWVHQMPTTHRIEATPIVVDGIMYVSEPPSNVFALDAATGRPYWHYKRSLPAKINVCCDAVNRGVAVLGDRVFLGTVDAHLVALSAKTGAVLWDVPVADSHTGYTHHRRAADRQRHGDHRRSRAANTASAAFSTPTMCQPASAAGASTLSPAPAKRATKRGVEPTPGSKAAAPPGSPDPTTPS